jgi:CRP-like cAMP-binding protein
MSKRLSKPRQGEQINLLLAAMNGATGSPAKIEVRPSDLKQASILCEPGEKLRHVYFPSSTVLSVMSALNDGTTVEVAIAGYEGAFGLLAAVGSGEASARCQVQIGGRAMRAEAGQLRSAFHRNDQVRRVVILYCEMQVFQGQQTVACNAKHAVAARLCRWLLAMHDRIAGDALPFTHDFLADLLGVNRTTVSLAAAALRRAGLIENSPGSVIIVDRKGLEETCCECYFSVRGRYERLLT